MPDRRTVALAIGVIAFIVALLGVSDVLARIGAQSLIAQTVQQDTGSTNRPKVSIHGWFFLSQVIRGRYDDVEIRIAPLDSGPLQIAEIHADLHGVHLSFHDLLVRNTHEIVVDRAEETATLHYDDLNRHLKTAGYPVALAFAGNQHLRVTGTVSILGRSISASADVALSAADNNNITITPTQFVTGIAGLDAVSRSLLNERFSLQIPLGALPFGQHIDRIDVQEHGIIVHTQGENITITD